MTPEQQIAELTKKLDTALNKMTAMESELAPLRAQARQPQQSQVDPRAIVQAMIQDPVGTLKQFGVAPEYQKHMTASLVTAEMQSMGIPVTPQMAAQTQQFPVMQKADAALTEAAALRQEWNAKEKASKEVANRESLKNITADKSKYPHLAAAMAKNPGRYAGRVTAESDVAALASEIENELAAMVTDLGYTKPNAQTASQEDAGSTTTTSTNVTAQPVGTRAGDPPPLPNKQPTSGFTEADDMALRERISRKHAAGGYNQSKTQ